MNIELFKASTNDASDIFEMQIITFKPLLDKYQDYDLNPGNEKIEKTMDRLNQEITDYYIIKLDNLSVGAIRIRRHEGGTLCQVGPFFILPEYQNRGIGQIVFKIIEEKYNPENGWILDTILQEKGNCYLYEKIGYKKTGKVENINENMDIVYYEKKKE